MSRRRRNRTPLQSIAIFTVCALFVLTALVGLYKCFSQPPTLPSQDQQGDTTDDSQQEDSALAPDSSENTAAANGRKDDFFTILVSGLDDENGGSDTNMLVALDAAGGAINVVSLPRDTLLNVDWTVKKLNNAYHHGGIDSTMAQISNLLGIPVDFHITVDLQAFVELVDAIEGVDFEVPFDMDYDDPYQDLHIHLKAGMQHLNGEQAIQVVRWRQNNDGTEYPNRDIGRIATQQAFLTAVAEQTLRLSNWDKIPAMAEIFQKWVDTDLKLSNLICMGEQALTIGSENISFHTLPGDGAGYYKGGSYYVLDAEGTLELINNYFNPYTRELTLDDMDILVP